jgi:hypothetical protein
MKFKGYVLAWVVLAAMLVSILAPQPGKTLAATPAGPAAIVNWNKVSQRTVLSAAKLTPVHAMAIIGFMHAAVYDSVVAI